MYQNDKKYVKCQKCKRIKRTEGAEPKFTGQAESVRILDTYVRCTISLDVSC